MTRRIFRTIAFTAVCALLAASLLVGAALYTSYENRLSGELRAEAEAIACALDMLEDDPSYLKQLQTKNRVTLIAADGAVLFDNQADPSSLPNHAQRPEILAAQQSGRGESSRYSDTLAETTIYYACRTQDGSVVRLGSTRASGLGIIWDVLPEICLMILLAMAVSMLSAKRAAKRIVAPVNAINLDTPLENEVYDEIAPLLTRMDRQHAQIGQQRTELERSQRETAVIMENMREGLMLLDMHSHVLSINKSAASIFGVSAGDQRDLLSVCREKAVADMVEEAKCGQMQDVMLTRGNRTYQLFASPVVLQDQVRGIALLILDVTEQFAAERSRREFSANVSHELKTPLTSISGCAEMIRDGIVKQEDIPTFAGKIHSEAQRMIALVNDILQLSRLDEKQGLGEKESVALMPLLKTLVETYQPLASEKGVALHLTGTDAQVEGYPALLREMLQNLIDNAIKYTPEGGSVEVACVRANGRTGCTIRDTGIGIPQEHHARIFERFYRVDKSHSRATGGTGLGLAIVKHVADVHHAQIELSSETGQGTTVTIWF